MTRTIVWSKDALRDLGEALGYFAETNPDHAQKLASELDAAVARLGIHATGRPGRVHGTFEKSLPKLKYIVAYSVHDRGQIHTLTVLCLVHTSRNWPSGAWPS